MKSQIHVMSSEITAFSMLTSCASNRLLQYINYRVSETLSVIRVNTKRTVYFLDKLRLFTIQHDRCLSYVFTHSFDKDLLPTREGPKRGLFIQDHPINYCHCRGGDSLISSQYANENTVHTHPELHLILFQ